MNMEVLMNDELADAEIDAVAGGFELFPGADRAKADAEWSFNDMLRLHHILRPR